MTAPREPRPGNLWRREADGTWWLVTTVWAGIILAREYNNCPRGNGCADCIETTHRGTHVSATEEGHKLEEFVHAHTFVGARPQPPRLGECWRTRDPDRALSKHWRVEGIDADGPSRRAVALRRESDGKQSTVAWRTFRAGFEPCTEHAPLPPGGAT